MLSREQLDRLVAELVFGWDHVGHPEYDALLAAVLADPEDEAVRFLSLEPLLESVDIEPWLAKGGIHWVIVGGESNQGGAQARPFQIEWVEEVVTQCRNHGVACFVKQMGSRPIANGLGLRLKHRHGGDWAEWPEWMRVREFPRVA